MSTGPDPAPRSGGGTHTDPALALGHFLNAFRDRSTRLVRHLHPEWVHDALGERAAAMLGASVSGQEGRMSVLLARAHGIEWPPADAFRRRWHRLALMPGPMAAQVLALVSLYVRRGAIRRCVDKASRQQLTQMVGGPAMALLVKAIDSDTRPVANDTDILDGAQRVGEGFALLRAGGLWTCQLSFELLRLALPRQALQPGDRAVPAVPAEELDVLFDRLGDCFPEQSWLFGSDMDRALSA